MSKFKYQIKSKAQMSNRHPERSEGSHGCNMGFFG